MRPAAYHKLSAPEKREQCRLSHRDRPRTCPFCDMQTSIADWSSHRERCEGVRDPDRCAKYVTFTEAMGAPWNVPRATLWRWVHRGWLREHVETREDTKGRKSKRRVYHLRDIVRLLDARDVFSEWKHVSSPTEK